MPLFRAAGELISDPEGVRFPMKDEAAGKDIPCLVTFEFLQARSGIGAADAQEMIEEFEIDDSIFYEGICRIVRFSQGG